MAETPVNKARERLLSGKFADFHIICEDREIPVHRAIISEESRVLDSACTGKLGFSTSRIEVLETDIKTMGRVLLFIYTGDYDDDTAPLLGSKKLSQSSKELSKRSCSSVDESTLVDSHKQDPSTTPKLTEPSTNVKSLVAESAYTRRLIANAKVYGRAKSLEIERLVPVAEKKFVSLARNGFTASDFLGAAQFVFEKTNPGDMGLRAYVLRICVNYMKSVKENLDLIQLLMRHEHLAWTLLDETKTRLIDNLKEAESGTAKMTSDFENLLSQNDKLIGDVLAARNQSRELMMRNNAIQAEVLAAKKEYREPAIRKDEVATENTKVATENNKVTTENNKLRAEVGDLKDLINRAKRRIKNVSRCRHCGEGFGACLEMNLSNNRFILRGAYCTTKH